MGRHTTASDVTAVVKGRHEGLSDRQLAERLGLTKGQVAGLFWRATSKKYVQQLRVGAGERLAARLTKYAAERGLPAAREVVLQAMPIRFSPMTTKSRSV